MTKEEAKELLPIIKAYSEGKTVQMQCNGEWQDVINPFFDDISTNYRIKPEPKYRPFENADECFKAVKEHGSWAKHKFYESYHQIIDINDDYVYFSAYSKFTLNEAIEMFVWADDNSSFGVIEI